MRLLQIEVLFNIQGDHKENLQIYESIAAVPFNKTNQNVRYSCLKVCVRDCGKQELLGRHTYGFSETNTKF